MLLVLSVLLLVQSSQQSMNGLSINVEDILSEKLMPVSFLMIGAHQSESSKNTTDLERLIPMKNVGKFQHAYATMDFHR